MEGGEGMGREWREKKREGGVPRFKRAGGLEGFHFEEDSASTI